MDRILFSERLVEQRKYAGYATQRDFAIAYDKLYNPSLTVNYGSQETYKGILGTIKDYENKKKTTSPNLEKVDNICKMLNCEIDYLLGNIQTPKRIYSVMQDELGLSQKATEKLIDWKKHSRRAGKLINVFLESVNFENLLFHASRLVEAKKLMSGLRTIRREQIEEVFSKPPDEDGAYNIPNGYNALDAQISNAEKEYASQRLYLNDYFTYIIKELESMATNLAHK